MTKSDLSVDFGHEVRRRREAYDLTLEELSHRAGLTPNFIGTIEGGKRDPSLSTILSLARGLGVKPGELFPSTAHLSVASDEAGRLFDLTTPEVQRAILGILRSLSKGPRRWR